MLGHDSRGCMVTRSKGMVREESMLAMGGGGHWARWRSLIEGRKWGHGHERKKYSFLITTWFNKPSWPEIDWRGTTFAIIYQKKNPSFLQIIVLAIYIWFETGYHCSNLVNLSHPFHNGWSILLWKEVYWTLKILWPNPGNSMISIFFKHKIPSMPYREHLRSFIKEKHTKHSLI